MACLASQRRARQLERLLSFSVALPFQALTIRAGGGENVFTWKQIELNSPIPPVYCDFW